MTDHVSHLGDHVASFERLAKEATFVGKIDRLLQLPGYDDDLDGWPPVVNRARKRQTIHAAWHLDVGDHQRDVGSRFQDCDGPVGIHRLNRRVAGVFHHIDRAHADHHLVLDDEDDGGTA